jgi:hypothetical protein
LRDFGRSRRWFNGGNPDSFESGYPGGGNPQHGDGSPNGGGQYNPTFWSGGPGGALLVAAMAVALVSAMAAAPVRAMAAAPVRATALPTKNAARLTRINRVIPGRMARRPSLATPIRPPRF